MANLLAESNFVIKWLEFSTSFELRACSNTKYEIFVYRIHMYTFASYWYIFVLREYQHWEELLLLKFDLTDSKTSPRSFCLAKVEKRRTCESCKTVVIWVSSSGTLLRRNFISSQTSTFPYFCHPPPPIPQLPFTSFVTSHIFQATFFCSSRFFLEILTTVFDMEKVNGEGCGKYNRFVRNVIALEWAIITIIMTILFPTFPPFVFSFTSFFSPLLDSHSNHLLKGKTFTRSVFLLSKTSAAG